MWEILQGTKETILPNTVPCREDFIIDCLSALHKTFEPVSGNCCEFINPHRKLPKYLWLSYTMKGGSNLNNRHFVFINTTSFSEYTREICTCKWRWIFKKSIHLYTFAEYMLFPQIVLDFGNEKFNKTRPLQRIFINEWMFSSAALLFSENIWILTASKNISKLPKSLLDQVNFKILQAKIVNQISVF